MERGFLLTCLISRKLITPKPRPGLKSLGMTISRELSLIRIYEIPVPAPNVWTNGRAKGKEGFRFPKQAVVMSLKKWAPSATMPSNSLGGMAITPGFLLLSI